MSEILVRNQHTNPKPHQKTKTQFSTAQHNTAQHQDRIASTTRKRAPKGCPTNANNRHAFRRRTKSITSGATLAFSFTRKLDRSIFMPTTVAWAAMRRIGRGSISVGAVLNCVICVGGFTVGLSIDRAGRQRAAMAQRLSSPSSPPSPTSPTTFSFPLKSTDSDDDSGDDDGKHIIFIRHGRTYMNDYLNGFEFGGPNFTDVFPDEPEYTERFYDSPLGPTGLEQTERLNESLSDIAQMGLSEEDQHRLLSLDLVVVSPLTRALQTMELGMLPYLKKLPSAVPIVALPEAAERLFLVSDIGKTRSELEKQYSYVDFTTGFETVAADSTSAQAGDKPEASRSDAHRHSLQQDHDRNAETGLQEQWHFTFSEEAINKYEEWRPHGDGQVYACPGEPEADFDLRMNRLHRWLRDRPERSIAVVCHWGIIDWMIQESFENCELRVVPFPSLKPRSLEQHDK